MVHITPKIGLHFGRLAEAPTPNLGERQSKGCFSGAKRPKNTPKRTVPLPLGRADRGGIGKSVNIFLNHPTIRHVIYSVGASPQQLIIELTERAVINQQTLAVLMDLARMGIEISLDDLGTGYSSLERLAQLPLASLKIPYEFTSQLGPTPDSYNSIARIMNAILAMGNALGLRVVVEGVETPAQKDFLLAQGFTLGQGFLFSLPLEETEVPPLQP